MHNAPTEPHQTETAHFKNHRNRGRVDEISAKAIETKKRVHKNLDIIIIIILLSLLLLLLLLLQQLLLRLLLLLELLSAHKYPLL